MRFSEAWLREWVNPDVSTDELSHQLSMAGLEVDAVEPAAGEFSGVVVGEVLSREQHPDADKLSVCSVNVGEAEPVQIVCGAKNVAAGMRVPVATVGAKLPGDFKIKKAKLRGVESRGMICSASELGLAESSDGIMPLPLDAPVGEGFRDFLALEDHCIEVDLTPDRGDCLSVAGIAREVGVINRTPLTPVEVAPVAAAIDAVFDVELAAPEACPRYLCRVIRGVDAKAESPQWLVEKLRRSGIRAISPVVDVTNFVLLELGQPMHGFDLAKLDGGIRVRLAESGEKLTLLDGNELELRDDTLVIADAGKPLALAGIMGGLDSGVTVDTQDVLLESAFFAPMAIIGKARGYGLHTDSSHRFERGVDFQLQRQAMERATALLQAICGGQAGPIVEQVAEACLPKREAITLRRERIPRILGIVLPDEQVVDILDRLGMQVEADEAGWRVTPPSARFDIGLEIDLIEELGRIYGYDRIPSRTGEGKVGLRLPPETGFDLSRAKQTLIDLGYQEAITYSFIAPEAAAKFAPSERPITLANPISADLSVMRPGLWPGLVQTVLYNQARQQPRVRVFESGLRFLHGEPDLRQEPMLAGAIIGDALPEQWAETGCQVDFYDIKADVEALLAPNGQLAHCRFEAAEHPVLHPGQCARILRGDQELGWIGQMHPVLAKSLGLSGALYLFELSLSVLADGDLPAFEPLSKFPSIRRDFALELDAEVEFARVLECARRAAPALVREIDLFDVYTGDKVDLGRKSFALSLILQESSHTLTEQEVEDATAGILAALTSELGAKLRD